MAKLVGRNLKGGICNCFDCGHPVPKGRAEEKREWQAEAKAELSAEEFSARWEDARRHLIESGYDEDIAASMAVIHALG